MSKDITPHAEGNSVSERVYNPIANAMFAAGSLASGVLLLRVAYWTKHAVIEKDGKRWVVKSREEWSADAGITFEQVKDAVPVLVKRGLIEKTGGVFRGKRAVFVRLSTAGHNAIFENVKSHPEAKMPKAGKVVPFKKKHTPEDASATPEEVLTILSDL